MDNCVWYDWDPVKFVSNRVKHGLSLGDAWQVFESPLRWDFPTLRAGSEARRVTTAFSPAAGAVCVLVYVERAGSIRCISFRRASKRERELYDEYLKEYRQFHE
jgi:uncharacterized DUF497 family protein